MNHLKLWIAELESTSHGFNKRANEYERSVLIRSVLSTSFPSTLKRIQKRLGENIFLVIKGSVHSTQKGHQLLTTKRNAQDIIGE